MNGAQITFAGILGADPELRFTAGGNPVATLSVAVGERRLNRNTQEWEDGNTTWYRVTVWNHAAEYAAECLTRGSRVIVTGTIRATEFADRQTGEKRYSWEVTADEIGVSIRFAAAFPHPADRSHPGTPANRDTWTAPSGPETARTDGAAESPAEPSPGPESPAEPPADTPESPRHARGKRSGAATPAA